MNLRSRILPSIENAYAPGSLLSRFRARRFAWFEEFVRPLPRPLTILDVGGTNEYWEQYAWAQHARVRITLLNLVAQPRRHGNIETVIGTATDLSQFASGSFDVVFSNSVIEHLFTWDKQCAMANEVRRVGRAYWVQTPNYWFPLEPHFRMVGWQWLPLSWRVAILRRRTCGWRGRTPDGAKAREVVREVRLVTRRELQLLFPDATLRPERVLGFVKSWIAIDAASWISHAELR